MIGGRLFKHSIVNMGPTALEAIAQIRADVYFMGVCSLHPESGISTGDFDEAGIKRALSEASQRTVVLASPEKLAWASPSRCPLSSDATAAATGRWPTSRRRSRRPAPARPAAAQTPAPDNAHPDRGR